MGNLNIVSIYNIFAMSTTCISVSSISAFSTSGAPIAPFLATIIILWIWITIKLRVFEKLSSISEIQYFKMPFTLIYSQTGSTTDNLLKFSHGTNFFVNHNQSAGFTVNSGREHFGSSYDTWIWLVNVNKVVKLLLSIVIVTGNPHYVTRILLA